MTLFVVSCGREKLSLPAPARLLYIGSMFRFGFAVASEEADLATDVGHQATVRILSAKHGLLDPDSVVDPYDLAMSDRGAVSAIVVADQLMMLARARSVEIHAFLPRVYLARLGAARDVVEQRGGRVLVHDLYQGPRGIGDQRQLLSRLRRSRSSDDTAFSWRRPPVDNSQSSLVRLDD